MVLYSDLPGLWPSGELEVSKIRETSDVPGKKVFVVEAHLRLPRIEPAREGP
jgi:hypothetical protein